MKKLEEHACFNGTLSVYEHESIALNCTMKFSVFLPPLIEKQNVPFITFLSGLTCTHDNFTTKAGAYKYASQAGLAVIAPDTSPRGENVPDDPAYDFGQGAGFYINATQAPWKNHFHMEDYITKDLQEALKQHVPQLDMKRQGITGHSMGGHGALTLGLKHPALYKSISAFAPIVAPCAVPWGQKAFQGYLGKDQSEWEKHDACLLMKSSHNRVDAPLILIDQGTSDPFLKEQLQPERFETACQEVNQAVTINMRAGYDHSYYFIQSFIEDHIHHHASIL